MAVSRHNATPSDQVKHIHHPVDATPLFRKATILAVLSATEVRQYPTCAGSASW